MPTNRGVAAYVLMTYSAEQNLWGPVIRGVYLNKETADESGRNILATIGKHFPDMTFQVCYTRCFSHLPKEKRGKE